MGLKTEKFYDPNKPLYASKVFKKDGKLYQKGDLVETRDMTHRQVLKFFQNRFIDHKKEIEQEQPVQSTQKETPSESSTEESTSDESVAKIVEDTEESFKVEYQGKIREISRNQIREDGTLTKGGLKAFEE